MAAVMRNAVLRPGADPTYADGDDASWMGVDWPSLQRTIEVDGQRVNVLDTGGDGPALLFLHGWSSNWQIFLLNIAAFMDTHRVLSLDLPRFDEAVVRRPRARRLAMQGVFRYPEKLSVPLARELVLSTGKPGFVAALDAILEYSYRDRLPQIEAPVLIVWGRNDLLVPVGDAFRYARLIGANARVEIFEDTGHAPMLERPSRFNALLRGFLAGEAAPEEGVSGV